MVGISKMWGEEGHFSSAAVICMARSKVGNSKKSPPAFGKAGPILIRLNGSLDGNILLGAVGREREGERKRKRREGGREREKGKKREGGRGREREHE